MWVQDDYRLSPRLTLNVGLRWDIFPSYSEVHNQYTFLNPKATNPITGNLGTLECGPGSAGIYSGSTRTPTWFKNIGPHVGLAIRSIPRL